MITLREGHKVISKLQVDEIWLADHRLTLLNKQWLQALYEEEDELAERLKHKREKLKQEILAKYDIIL